MRIRAGDGLKEELGADDFDLVFLSNLLHHFDPSQSRNMIRRVARSLRPGGNSVIQEPFTPSSAGQTGQAGALANLYFALTNASGTLSVGDMAAWEVEAAGAVRDVPGSRPAKRGETRIADLRDEIVMAATASALRDAFA